MEFSSRLENLRKPPAFFFLGFPSDKTERTAARAAEEAALAMVSFFLEAVHGIHRQSLIIRKVFKIKQCSLFLQVKIGGQTMNCFYL